jgi:hypothetical protein
MIELGDLKLYTQEEVGKMLDIAVTTVKKYRREGKLKGKQVGHKCYFPEDELYIYLSTPDVVTPPTLLEAVRKQPQPEFLDIGGGLHLPMGVINNPNWEAEHKRKEAEHKRKQKELQKAEQELVREAKRMAAAKRIAERAHHPRKRNDNND